MLDALGNPGDFLGGIGVGVTLVNLAIQIRQNTASEHASAHQEATKALSDWSSSRPQYRLLITSLCRHFEYLHLQCLQGAMDENTWPGGQQRITGTLHGDGVQRFWQRAESAGRALAEVPGVHRSGRP
jgi:hypothetical protein